MNAPQVIVRFYNDANHCGRTTDGRDFLAVGCVHKSPRAAVAHADELTGVLAEEFAAPPPSETPSEPGSRAAGRGELPLGRHGQHPTSLDPTASEVATGGQHPLATSLDAGPDPVSAGRGSELVENLGP